MKISAMLLSVWYCVSVIGFDVHTCLGSGASFVTSAIGGMTCEDIHPEHICSQDSCCASHGCHDSGSCGDGSSLVLKSMSCCTDDIRQLSLSGCRVDDENRNLSEFHFLSCACELPHTDAGIHAEECGRPSLSQGTGCFADTGGRLSWLRVWRI